MGAAEFLALPCCSCRCQGRQPSRALASLCGDCQQPFNTATCLRSGPAAIWYGLYFGILTRDCAEVRQCPVQHVGRSHGTSQPTSLVPEHAAPVNAWASQVFSRKCRCLLRLDCNSSRLSH